MKPKKNPVTKIVAAGVKAVAKTRQPKLKKLAKNYDNALKVRAGKAPESKIEKRAIKAANKPTNKIGSKADNELRSRTKSVVMSKEETKASYDYYYGKGSGKGITQINKRVTPKNEAMSVRKMPKKSK